MKESKEMEAREIKFRCWYKPTQEMLEWKFFIEEEFVLLRDVLVDNTQGVPMQYTGLKADKEEMYEYDIVELEGFTSKYIIQFIEGAFCLEDIRNHTEKWEWDIPPIDIHYTQTQKTTILGNKFENPELLSASIT